MALITVRGYVVALRDFSTFDQVVTFLDEQGRILRVLARGVRKITSKNGRHLVVGNFNESEIFASRFLDQTLSKLKKTVALVPVPWAFHDYAAFALLNEYASLQTTNNRALFNYYQGLCDQLKTAQFRDVALLMTALVFITRTEGLLTARIKCSDCATTDDIAVDRNDGAWRCKACLVVANGDRYPMTKADVTVLRAIFNHERITKPVSQATVIALVRFFRWLFATHLGMHFNSLQKWKREPAQNGVDQLQSTQQHVNKPQ